MPPSSSSNKLPFSSSFRPYSLFLVILFVVLLAVILVIVCTLGDASSFQWTRRHGSLLGFASTKLTFSGTSQVFAVADPPPTSSLNPQIGERQEGIGKDKVSEKINVTSATNEVKRQSRLEKIEATLARARLAIKEAGRVQNKTSTYDDPDYVPRGPIYRNAKVFHRSYLEMERIFKIYVYEEGEQPLFNDGPCKSVYATEGRFIHELAMDNNYRTSDPNKAYVYFLPYSVVAMVRYLYVPDSHDMSPIGRTIADYVNVIANKHPYWNRSLGADHVIVSCHDWGPYSSSYSPFLYNMSIRALCNANTSEGFIPSKDVSFPEVQLKTGEIKGILGGPSASSRHILAFFAGGRHGHIRHLLLEHWKEKDKDVLVYEQLPKHLSYDSMFKNSKFCLCPSGYEVATARVMDAIYAECVPVLISDGFVPPFSDVLNWKSFSVQVKVKDIPNIKGILSSISQKQYISLQRRVKQVQRHFVVNGPSKRFDIFHMTVHSIWLRRLNLRLGSPSGKAFDGNMSK
ncbi:hypothetical protein SO802_024892 [Lithocarpus litseifolius]|uniref:Exostosin GT47 domain-containing protein n=1 Tax=Lithocarpus litseifolius TaxID=425828 RepID=A0AAW2CDH0_9ROSI